MPMPMGGFLSPAGVATQSDDGVPPRLRPNPLTLPGARWPDGGEGDVFPVEQAFASLARVRWAPGRGTIWLAPGAPEPE
jgi:hypothetical protein